MPSRLLNLCIAAAVAVGFLAGSPRASAEFVKLTYIGTPNSASALSVNLDGVPYDGGMYAQRDPGPFYWTPAGIPPNASFPNPTVTFCIEIAPNQDLPVKGATAEFAVVSPAAAPSISAPTAGVTPAQKADAIKELYGRFYNDLWNSGAFAGSPESVAFQIALWELVYDGPNAGNGSSLSGGRFSVDPAVLAVTAGMKAQDWLANGGTTPGITGNTSSFDSRFANASLVALLAPSGTGGKSQDQVQDQITLIPKPVPAPPGVVLAGIGFLGLIGRARRVRRIPAAA